MPTRGDSLHLAALRGKPYRIAACLGRSHDPDILDDRGRTPLFIACSFGHVSAARTLLGAGANVDLRNPEGMSPLDAVLRAGYAELLRELVWAGADLRHAGVSVCEGDCGVSAAVIVVFLHEYVEYTPTRVDSLPCTR